MNQKWTARIAAALAVLTLTAGVSTAAFARQNAASPQQTVLLAQGDETKEPTREPQKTPSEEPTTQAQHTHKFGDWKTARKATTEKNGLRVRTCTLCDEQQTKQIPRVKSAVLHHIERVYTGKKVKFPGVTVKDKTGKALKENRDYTVRTKNDKNVGIATVVITGAGNYKFKILRNFRILPQAAKVKKVLPGSSSATVQWNAVKQSSGYFVQIAADKAFTKNDSIRKIKSGKTTSTVLSGLKEKSTYYVRMRTFTKIDGRTLTSNWSKAVKFTTPAASLHAIDGQLPKSARVSSSYFDDVVFVGDSVSLGLNYYEAASDVLGKAQFLTAGSLGSGNALGAVTEQSVHPRYNGQKMKIEKAIPLTGAKKVYIMLGMNDIGAYGVDKSAENFRTLCKKIKQEAPDVRIFVQSVTPRVNQGAKSDNVKLNNQNITSYNKKLAAICQQEGWYFVNGAEFMFDSTGHLIRSYCSDPDGMGMHFSYEGCKAWVDYLYTHTA